MIGGFLLGVGVTSSAFSQSVFHMYLTYGSLAGISFLAHRFHAPQCLNNGYILRVFSILSVFAIDEYVLNAIIYHKLHRIAYHQTVNQTSHFNAI